MLSAFCDLWSYVTIEAVGKRNMNATQLAVDCPWAEVSHAPIWTCRSLMLHSSMARKSYARGYGGRQDSDTRKSTSR